MSPEQKQRYLSQIKDDLAASEASILELEGARNMAEGKMHSRYDTQKEELNTQVNIARDIQEKAKKLHDEIEASDFRYSVESGAFLDLVINGEPKQFLFMENGGSLREITIITQESPIGKSIVGRIPGAVGEYIVGQKRFKVEIKSIL